jgi:hypothetical protein
VNQYLNPKWEWTLPHRPLDLVGRWVEGYFPSNNGSRCRLSWLQVVVSVRKILRYLWATLESVVWGCQGLGSVQSRGVVVLFAWPHRTEGGFSPSWISGHKCWLCWLLQTIFLIDSIFALNAQVWSSPWGHLVEEILGVVRIQGTWMSSSPRVFYVTFALFPVWDLDKPS